jgi:hypothetical protein
MPLPQSPHRTPIHRRTITFEGWRRTDGHIEIDGRVMDIKSEDNAPPGAPVIPAGSPVHDMSIRMVMDDQMHIHSLMACIDASPYPICPEAQHTLHVFVGEQVGAGWTRRVKEGLRGARSCTHLMELLIAMGTMAFQCTTKERLKQIGETDANGRPLRIDSCYAYGADRAVVKVLWPAHHTGRPEPG